jgi:pilus assembly protein CpaD
MRNRLSLSLCAGLGLMLAACGADNSAMGPPVAAPKQLKVDYTELKHPAEFVHASAKLAPGEAKRLDAFLDSAAVTPQDHVFIEVASGDRLAAERIGSLAHALAQRGVGARVLPAGDHEVAADQLLVKVERYVVTPPACPDWTKSPFEGHDNTVGSNFGCANTTNLGLMVADPRDLVVGRTLGPEEGDPAIAGIERYRAGKPKDFIGSGSAGGYSPVTIEMPGSSSGSSSGGGQ